MAHTAHKQDEAPKNEAPDFEAIPNTFNWKNEDFINPFAVTIRMCAQALSFSPDKLAECLKAMEEKGALEEFVDGLLQAQKDLQGMSEMVEMTLARIVVIGRQA